MTGPVCRNLTRKMPKVIIRAGFAGRCGQFPMIQCLMLRRVHAKANELIVQALEEAGVSMCSGFRGAGPDRFQPSVREEDRIKAILCRHEQTAAIMADAYARASGKPAVVMGQGLFIGSNATFGIMESMLSSSPMLVLTDTSDGGLGPASRQPVGSRRVRQHRPAEHLQVDDEIHFPGHQPQGGCGGTQLALKHATSGRPGPAAVVMRSASIGGEVDLEAPPFIHPTGGYLNTAKPQSSPQDIQRAVDILASSRRPVLVAGNGVHVSGAHEQLRRLAEMWNAPVATSYKGKSAISETHPLSLGMVGVYGQAAANQVVGEADTVVIVGAKLSPQDTVRESPNVFNPRQQHIIQIDIDDRNAGWTFPIELGLTGDAAAIMDQLLDASEDIAANTGIQREEWVGSVPRKKSDRSFYRDPALGIESSPVTPQRLVATLQETLPTDTVFSLDAGNNRTWMAHFYQAQQAKTFFAPGGTAGMGWGLPAAVALKLVYPDRPVCCVTGDGGYMMTVNALSTAVQYELPILCVVFNDSALGMVLDHQEPGREIASEFVQTDNGAVARGMGAFGIQVNNSRDLPDAIREAQASGLPAVVDVIVDREPSPDDWRADLRTAGRPRPLPGPNHRTSRWERFLMATWSDSQLALDSQDAEPGVGGHSGCDAQDAVRWPVPQRNAPVLPGPGENLSGQPQLRRDHGGQGLPQRERPAGRAGPGGDRRSLQRVLGVLQESHEKGAKSAVIISAGFSERGEDDRSDLQGELTRFAQESGLRCSGPNCLGLANVRENIWASSSSRGSDGLTGPVGLICQSGASAFGPFLTRAVEEGIGLSHIISTGNEADLDFCDFAATCWMTTVSRLSQVSSRGSRTPASSPRSPNWRRNGGNRLS